MWRTTLRTSGPRSDDHMALAVTWLSPVSMTTSTPAWRSSATVRALRQRTLDMMLVAVAIGSGWLYSVVVTLRPAR